MNREPWVVYLVVTLVVIAMMYGKYLMGMEMMIIGTLRDEFRE